MYSSSSAFFLSEEFVQLTQVTGNTDRRISEQTGVFFEVIKILQNMKLNCSLAHLKRTLALLEMTLSSLKASNETLSGRLRGAEARNNELVVQVCSETNKVLFNCRQLLVICLKHCARIRRLKFLQAL